MENSGVPLNMREILKDFMKELNFSFLSCLYVASRDGFGAKDFRAKCNGKNKIIVFIKANGFYFGGYTSSSFNFVGFSDGHSGKTVHSDYSFIFSLSNPQNKPTFFKCVKPEYSILDRYDLGPVFGGGSDIVISDNSNQIDNSYTDVEYSYQGKKKRSLLFYFLYKKKGCGYNHGSNEARNFLCGSEYFKVEEIEVYQLN